MNKKIVSSVHIIDNILSFVNTLQRNFCIVLSIANYAKIVKQNYFKELTNDSGQVKNA